MFLLLIAVAIAGGVAFYNLHNKSSQKVYAGTGDNVTGYAWSENIGWISFNNTNTGGGVSYGVNIAQNSGVGVLSGYAWSENIGWISFDRTVTGTPPNNDVGQSYGVLAIVDSNNKLQGWARALTACDENGDGDCVDTGESDAGINAGGWDGWIRLTGTNYGVTLNTVTKDFSGFVWGSDVLGWISFNNLSGGGSVNYKVSTTFSINTPPGAGGGGAGGSPNIILGDSDYCSDRIIFNWVFNDADGDTQSRYIIEAAYGAGGYKIIRDVSGLNDPSGSTITIGVPLSGGVTSLKTLMGAGWYGQTLNWRVTVYDSRGASGVVVGESKSMASSEYPVPDFSNTPTQISINKDVQFSDGSDCYTVGNPDSNPVACSDWLWSFQDATPASSPDQNPVVQFNSGGNKNVSLTAGDGAKSCSISRSVNAGLPLPDIKETK